MNQPTLFADRNVTIRRTTTVDQVVATVSDLIFQGELPPGTPLREEALAASLGVARTTLREALKELIHKGLVRHHAHRGSAVVTLTPVDVADLYRVRRLLELPAVRTCLSGEDRLLRIERLEAIVERAEAAARGGRIADLVHADLAFHREVVSWLGSSRTDQYFDSILNELRIGFAQVEREQRSLTAQASVHREILECLQAGDGEGCARVLGDHLADSEETVGAAVARSVSEDAGPQGSAATA